MRELNSILCAVTCGVVAAAALVGCQRAVNVPRGRVNETPLVVDEAMQIRDWDRSSAHYEDPRFIAGPTGFWFISPGERPQWYYSATETPIFVAQTVMLPVTLLITPVWTPVRYAGETLEPTHHAMPPLPPSRDERVRALESTRAQDPYDDRMAEPAPVAAPAARTAVTPTPTPPATPPRSATTAPAGAAREATAAPRAATAAPAATQPARTVTPSAVAPVRTAPTDPATPAARTAPATRPATGPAARPLNK